MSYWLTRRVLRMPASMGRGSLPRRGDACYGLCFERGKVGADRRHNSVKRHTNRLRRRIGDRAVIEAAMTLYVDERGELHDSHDAVNTTVVVTARDGVEMSDELQRDQARVRAFDDAAEIERLRAEVEQLKAIVEAASRETCRGPLAERTCRGWLVREQWCSVCLAVEEVESWDF